MVKATQRRKMLRDSTKYSEGLNGARDQVPREGQGIILVAAADMDLEFQSLVCIMITWESC